MYAAVSDPMTVAPCFVVHIFLCIIIDLSPALEEDDFHNKFENNGFFIYFKK